MSYACVYLRLLLKASLLSNRDKLQAR